MEVFSRISVEQLPIGIATFQNDFEWLGLMLLKLVKLPF